MNRPAVALLGIGVVALGLAGGWWWLTYGEVIGFDYIGWREAGRCMIGDSDICRLARALCRGSHPRLVADYAAPAFWLALAPFSFALLLANRTRAS